MAKFPRYYKVHASRLTVELEPIYDELVPTVHAHWIINGEWGECSNPKCREASKLSVMDHKDFCPACGAIMDEEDRQNGEA